jgi:hypothetical protein
MPTESSTLGSEDRADLLPSMIVATTLELVAEGYDVWLVRDVPRFDFDPPRRLALADRFGEIDAPGEPLADHLQQQAPFDRAFAAVEGEHVHVIDLPRLLCVDGFCPVAVDGQVLYRDHHHLTKTGAHFVEPAFGPLFGRIARSTGVEPVH